MTLSLQQFLFDLVILAVVLLATGCLCVGVWKFRLWLPEVTLWRLPRPTIMVLISAALAATIMAQKGDRGTGDPPVGGGATGTSRPATGDPPVANVITNTLHFSCISVDTNGDVTLTAAWPGGHLSAGWTIDVLGKGNLFDEVWTWRTNGIVAADATNISWTLQNLSPSNFFFKAVVRDTLIDMDDPDGDGLPDAYEIAHGTNPFVSDYTLAQKLTVGPDGIFADIGDAIVASEPYSIIEIDPAGQYESTEYLGIQMPQHPIMLTSSNAYAVVRATGLTAFMLATNTTSQTLFRNLYLLLDAQGSFQTGFWCGGNLPWDGVPASATFENIYMRMPNPGVQYRGWIFYRNCADTAAIRNCTINASGATWAVGIDAYGSPRIVVDRCTFVNFPPETVSNIGCGALLRTAGISDAGSDVTISRALFDESFTNAWPLARFDSTNSYFVTVSDCLLPRALPSEYLPDISTNVTVTNAMLTWSGIPHPCSPSVALGIGSLMPIANDPFVDSDGDGLCDYDEAYDLGTDPFNADSDNDGIEDGTEILTDETDPINPHSFKQRLTVSVTNTVSPAHTIYTAWGYSLTGWETNGLEIFSQGFGDTVYTNASSQGATHVKAFCDLNGSGEYEAAKDILIVLPIPGGAMAQVNFAFGDVDGDGVSDAQERQEGTDPYDSGNFRLVATVNVESSDVVPGLTNFVALGYLPTGWETNDLVAFAGNSLPFSVDGVATNGELYVKVFRDFNTNGVYDAGADALVLKKLIRTDNGKTVTFRIGDSDNDRIADSVELAEGTNPFDRSNYCFNLSQTYTGVFQTTNALTFAAYFGTNRVYGPCVVADRVWTHDFGHCVAANGEKVSVSVWDDANHNGEWDEGETINRYVTAITGHDMVVTNALTYGNFDHDGNTLPDWWEEVTGLCATSMPHGSLDDTDGDGLINLYEYQYGFNPLVSDATNTFQSVVRMSMSMALVDVSNPTSSMPKFVDYQTNGENGIFVTNWNFWAKNIDTTCASMWNNATQSIWGTPCSGPHMAGTAISKRHVIYANHFAIPHGTQLLFLGTDGIVVSRTLVNSEATGVDIRIGVLDSELPDTIRPAKILPSCYTNYLPSARYLPVVTFDQEEKLIVEEIDVLRPYAERVSLSKARLPSNAFLTPFFEPIVDRDSGNPCFCIVHNELVLLYVIYKRGGGEGCLIGNFAFEIQNIMSRLAPGYLLGEIDLSEFTVLP